MQNSRKFVPLLLAAVMVTSACRLDMLALSLLEGSVICSPQHLIADHILLGIVRLATHIGIIDRLKRFNQLLDSFVWLLFAVEALSNSRTVVSGSYKLEGVRPHRLSC